jgi:hypothetical protein
MHDVAVKEFSAALAHPDAVVTDADTLTAKGHDYWGFGGTPGLLLRPTTREEVIAVLRIAANTASMWSPSAPSPRPSSRSLSTPPTTNWRV